MPSSILIFFTLFLSIQPQGKSIKRLSFCLPGRFKGRAACTRVRRNTQQAQDAQLRQPTGRRAKDTNTRPWKAAAAGAELRFSVGTAPWRRALREGRMVRANWVSPESERQELFLSFLPGITLTVWLIPKVSRHFLLLQPNSLVPISSLEAALSLCYISG